MSQRAANPTPSDRLRFNRIDRRIVNRLANPRSHETDGWVRRDTLEKAAGGSAVVHSANARIRKRLEHRGLTVKGRSIGGGMWVYRIERLKQEKDAHDGNTTSSTATRP